MWRTSGFGFTISANVKKATPRQWQSNLLQVVTQWKSETSSNGGRALNSSQVNVFAFSTNPPISRRQSFNAISGLMPRSRIGKPWVRCWPGGRRSLGRGPSRAGGFARRSGDFPLPEIFRAQRSLRSIRLGLGVAMIGILTADHPDCADILQLNTKTTRLRDNKDRPTVSRYKFRLGRAGRAFGAR